MNYIGSKLSILNFIKNSIKETLILSNDKREAEEMTFADLFAGTGIVGATFKEEGFRIISNDMQYYSYVLNKHLIENNNELAFGNLFSLIPDLQNINIEKRKFLVLSYLDKLEGKEGFIYKNYSYGGTKDLESPRIYFSDENAKQGDAIREAIEEWYEQELIEENEFYFLLASLIDSIDKVANTASVYGAFLKKLKKSAQKKLQMKEYQSIIFNKHNNKVFNEDVNTLIKTIKGDILYLDPPYNHRQYSANYHILETIAKYDSPKIKGKTGLREYEDQKSLYCSKVNAIRAFEELIENANFQYIFLSYNDEGIIPMDEIERIFSKKGKYKKFELNYKRFQADKDENRKHKKKSTIEYLHCLSKH